MRRQGEGPPVKRMDGDRGIHFPRTTRSSRTAHRIRTLRAAEAPAALAWYQRIRAGAHSRGHHRIFRGRSLNQEEEYGSGYTVGRWAGDGVA